MDHLFKTYAQVVSKTIEIDQKPKTNIAPKPNAEAAPKPKIKTAPKPKKIIRGICKYDKICYAGKMCGDCFADDYEKDSYNTSYDNLKFEHRMDLINKSNYDD